MNEVTIQGTRYGSLPAGPGEPVAPDVYALSLDLRGRTGDNPQDETGWLHPGTVRRTVFPTAPGMLPVGEVRILVRGQEVRIVGELTGRPGVQEITPDHLRACLTDTAYRATIQQWLGIG